MFVCLELENCTGLAGSGWAGCRYCNKATCFFAATCWPIKVDGQPLPSPQPRGAYNPNLHAEKVEQSCTEKRGHTRNTSKKGDKGKARMFLKELGWSKKEVSPFWELLWMRHSFYQCFGICLLHIELLGLVKVHSTCVSKGEHILTLNFVAHLNGAQRHLQFTCNKNNIKKELNKRFRALPPFPGKQGFSTQVKLVKNKPSKVLHKPFLSIKTVS